MGHPARVHRFVRRTSLRGMTPDDVRALWDELGLAHDVTDEQIAAMLDTARELGQLAVSCALSRGAAA